MSGKADNSNDGIFHELVFQKDVCLMLMVLSYHTKKICKMRAICLSNAQLTQSCSLESLPMHEVR